ncbi:MAG TPA: glycosyltransferase family 2 protein, partial [bacterium]|nr:glycosyltransferase family 2 protein [bacterium]
GLPHPGALGPLHRNSQGVPQQTFGKHPTLWNEWRRKCLEKNLRRGNARAATRFEKTCRGTREVAWVSGSCLLIAREALQAAGPWDEDYFLYFEDMDWCLRAQKAGYRVYHTGEVSVLHEHGEAWRLPRKKHRFTTAKVSCVSFRSTGIPFGAMSYDCTCGWPRRGVSLPRINWHQRAGRCARPRPDRVSCM